MSFDTELIALPEALEAAGAQAQTAGLSHAGGVALRTAWALVQAGEVVPVGVRSAEEKAFVGRVPDSLHVAWATGTALTRNPRFVRELEAKLAPHGGKEAVALLLCRSGKSSMLAADAVASLALWCGTRPCVKGHRGAKRYARAHPRRSARAAAPGRVACPCGEPLFVVRCERARGSVQQAGALRELPALHP